MDTTPVVRTFSRVIINGLLSNFAKDFIPEHYRSLKMEKKEHLEIVLF